MNFSPKECSYNFFFLRIFLRLLHFIITIITIRLENVVFRRIQRKKRDRWDSKYIF